MNDGNGLSLYSQYSAQFRTQLLNLDNSEDRLMSELSIEVSLQMFPLSFFLSFGKSVHCPINMDREVAKGLIKKSSDSLHLKGS